MVIALSFLKHFFHLAPSISHLLIFWLVCFYFRFCLGIFILFYFSPFSSPPLPSFPSLTSSFLPFSSLPLLSSPYLHLSSLFLPSLPPASLFSLWVSFAGPYQFSYPQNPALHLVLVLDSLFCCIYTHSKRDSPSLMASVASCTLMIPRFTSSLLFSPLTSRVFYPTALVILSIGYPYRHWKFNLPVHTWESDTGPQVSSSHISL